MAQGGNANELLQQEHYYPFGMGIRGEWKFVQPQVGGVNQYLYNGKELNDDYGLNWNDYGARWYDASIARWNGVDPLAEDYSTWSGYNYVLGNPIRFIDPDGMRVAGDYYSANGSYLGSDGKKDDKVYVATSVTKNKEGVVTGAAGSSLLMDQDGQHMSHNEFLKVAAAVYGEASTDGGIKNTGKQESFGMASVIKNRMTMDNKSAWDVTQEKADAVGGRKYKKFNTLGATGRNENQRAKDAIAGVINALEGGVDYSNGADGWDGRDLAMKGKSHARYRSYNGKQGIHIPRGIHNDVSDYLNSTKGYLSTAGNEKAAGNLSLYSTHDFKTSRYTMTGAAGHSVFYSASSRVKLTGSYNRRKTVRK